MKKERLIVIIGIVLFLISLNFLNMEYSFDALSNEGVWCLFLYAIAIASAWYIFSLLVIQVLRKG